MSATEILNTVLKKKLTVSDAQELKNNAVRLSVKENKKLKELVKDLSFSAGAKLSESDQQMRQALGYWILENMQLL